MGNQKNVMLPVTTTIDDAKCTGCGLCISVCPMRTISLVNGKARVTGARSLNCGHCAAACPEYAIHVAALDPQMSVFAGFEADCRWLPHGDHDTRELVRLMASRRSCREYLHRVVEPSILEALAKIGAMAPSGSNSQLWTFTILPTGTAVQALVKPVVQFYERINGLVKKGWFRSIMKIMGRHGIDFYYRGYLHYIEENIRNWKTSGQDAFFHAAPSAIIVGSKPHGILTKEDAFLATQNILLAAHSMGLGTCLLGLVAGAMQKKGDIAGRAGIPSDESVHAVIAIGYPNESYVSQAGRKKADIRFTEL